MNDNRSGMSDIGISVCSKSDHKRANSVGVEMSADVDEVDDALSNTNKSVTAAVPIIFNVNV